MADRLDFQLLALGLRRTAWIRFWIQTALGVVVVGVLMFNNIGGSLSRNADRAVGLSPGLSLTTLSFFVLLFSLWQGWLIVRLGRALDSGARPSRGEASRLLKRGIFADLLGILSISSDLYLFPLSLCLELSGEGDGGGLGPKLSNIFTF